MIANFFEKLNSGLLKVNAGLDDFNKNMKDRLLIMNHAKDIKINLSRESIIIENSLKLANLELKNDRLMKETPGLKEAYDSIFGKYKDNDENGNELEFEDYIEPDFQSIIISFENKELLPLLEAEISHLKEVRNSLFKETCNKLAKDKNLIPYFVRFIKERKSERILSIIEDCVNSGIFKEFIK